MSICSNVCVYVHLHVDMYNDVIILVSAQGFVDIFEVLWDLYMRKTRIQFEMDVSKNSGTPKTPKWINPHPLLLVMSSYGSPGPTAQMSIHRAWFLRFRWWILLGSNCGCQGDCIFCFVFLFPVSPVDHFEPKPKPCHFGTFQCPRNNMYILYIYISMFRSVAMHRGGSFPKPSRFPQRCQQDSTSWRYKPTLHAWPPCPSWRFQTVPASLVQTVPWKMEQRSCKKRVDDQLYTSRTNVRVVQCSTFNPSHESHQYL